MVDTAAGGKTDYSKLISGSSAGGGALGIGVVAVWFINTRMSPPMPPEIAAAAVGSLVWLINNVAVFLKAETSKL
jgi:hypothetical protein